jgi:hypothetical protein
VLGWWVVTGRQVWPEAVNSSVAAVDGDERWIAGQACAAAFVVGLQRTSASFVTVVGMKRLSVVVEVA